MGGTLSIESQQDQGSTFLFTIKASSCESEEIDVSNGKESISVTNKKDLSILVVEDNIINQMIAGDFLSHLGFNADIADNGQLALEALKTKQYDIVFMDMQMPVMDGIDATK